MFPGTHYIALTGLQQWTTMLMNSKSIYKIKKYLIATMGKIAKLLD